MTDADAGRFKAWYDKQKDEYNAKRRERYKEDKVYRDTSIKQCDRYRSGKPKAESRTKVFIVGGREVVGHNARRVVLDSPVSIHGLLPLERSNAIPKHTLPSSQRYYTEHQVELLKRYFKDGSDPFITWSEL